MKERGKEGELDFWDGHSFRDNCEWTPRSTFRFNPIPIDSVRQIISDFSRDLRATNELKRLIEQLDKEQISPTQRFEKGEIFDPKGFLPGTLIGLSIDYQNNGKSMYWGDSERNTHYLYGVVLEQIVRRQKYEVLVCYKSQQAHEGILIGVPNKLFYDPVQVGAVKHYRQNKAKDPLDHFEKIDKRFQSLERVNFVEVLQYGRRLRKRQPLSRTSLSLSPDALNPWGIFMR